MMALFKYLYIYSRSLPRVENLHKVVMSNQWPACTANTLKAVLVPRQYLSIYERGLTLWTMPACCRNCLYIHGISFLIRTVYLKAYGFENLKIFMTLADRKCNKWEKKSLSIWCNLIQLSSQWSTNIALLNEQKTYWSDTVLLYQWYKLDYHFYDLL